MDRAEAAGRDLNAAEAETVEGLISKAERGSQQSEALLTAAGGLVHVLGRDRASMQILATAALALTLNGLDRQTACRRLTKALREYEKAAH